MAAHPIPMLSCKVDRPAHARRPQAPGLRTFADYLSAHRRTRGPSHRHENRVFKLRIQHGFALCLAADPAQHKQLPANFPAEQPTYDQSGWCGLEQAVARLLCDERDGGARSSRSRSRRIRRVRCPRAPHARRCTPSPGREPHQVPGRADRETVAQLYRSFAEHVVEPSTEAAILKLSEHHVKRQEGGDRRVRFLCCCSSSIWKCFTLLESEDGVIGNPFWAFLYFAIVNGVVMLHAQDRVFLCLCSPIYRFRWRNAGGAAVLRGPRDGPDPPDQMRFVVGRRGLPRGHRDRATVAPEAEAPSASSPADPCPCICGKNTWRSERVEGSRDPGMSGTGPRVRGGLGSGHRGPRKVREWGLGVSGRTPGLRVCRGTVLCVHPPAAAQVQRTVARGAVMMIHDDRRALDADIIRVRTVISIYTNQYNIIGHDAT